MGKTCGNFVRNVVVIIIVIFILFDIINYATVTPRTETTEKLFHNHVSNTSMYCRPMSIVKLCTLICNMHLLMNHNDYKRELVVIQLYIDWLVKTALDSLVGLRFSGGSRICQRGGGGPWRARGARA